MYSTPLTHIHRSLFGWQFFPEFVLFVAYNITHHCQHIHIHTHPSPQRRQDETHRILYTEWTKKADTNQFFIQQHFVDEYKMIQMRSRGLFSISMILMQYVFFGNVCVLCLIVRVWGKQTNISFRTIGDLIEKIRYGKTSEHSNQINRLESFFFATLDAVNCDNLLVIFFLLFLCLHYCRL